MNTRSLLISVAMIFAASGLTAQTLFTTPDYTQDQALWTDPAYYNFNTARELTDMQINDRYGQRGSGEDAYTLTSPYPYKTSESHYQAWLELAGGGTKHDFESLPNWDGLWGGGSSWLNSRSVQASTVASVLTPQFQQYYVQQVKADSEGRHWWPASYCLPDGYVRGVWRGPKEFVLRPGKVWIISSMLTETQVRWISGDGREHSAAEMSYSKWQGESIGFWDGAALVIHTNQIRGWNATHSLFEWTDEMTAVERYELIDGVIQGEVTLYDPTAFIAPLHAKFEFRPVEIPGFTMSYDTCTDSNGPSGNIFLDSAGRPDERVFGDEAYWDPTISRPWSKQYEIGE